MMVFALAMCGRADQRARDRELDRVRDIAGQFEAPDGFELAATTFQEAANCWTTLWGCDEPIIVAMEYVTDGTTQIPCTELTKAVGDIALVDSVVQPCEIAATIDETEVYARIGPEFGGQRDETEVGRLRLEVVFQAANPSGF